MAFHFVPVVPEIHISGFHSVYYFEFDKNFYHPPERHDFWELVYVDDGSLIAVVDGIGCSLSRGQVIFHQPTEQHSHIANRKDSSNVVVIAFACDSPIMRFFNKKIFTLEKPSQKTLSLFLSEARNALGKLPGEYEDKSPLDFSNARPGSVQLMQCYLVEFLFTLIRSNEDSVLPMTVSPASRTLAESSLVDSITAYMEAHLGEQPSLSTLCRHFSVSQTSLCRIFKAAMGTSPIDHWISLKIRAARKLLRREDRNVTQIAEELGYSSIHHFSRTFKRVTGMSPSAYRGSVSY